MDRARFKRLCMRLTKIRQTYREKALQLAQQSEKDVLEGES